MTCLIKNLFALVGFCVSKVRVFIDKATFMANKLDTFKNTSNKDSIYTGSRLYYMGEHYYVRVLEFVDIKAVDVKFDNSQFIITTPLVMRPTDSIAKAINMFYKNKAIEHIMPLADKWMGIMNVAPQKIGFRNARTRWGSCSSVNNISFNFNLMKLPLALVEYIVVHEFAHIIHKNHSKDFWNEVYKYMPDYKTREKEIRVFERLVF